MKTRITSVKARQVWDSRGHPTVEAQIGLEGGAVGRAIAPAGASRGHFEAVDLRDGGARFGGLGVDKAVANVNGAIAKALVGRDGTDQAGVDTCLTEMDGTAQLERLGGNACVAVSLAVLHAAANAAGLPLWRYLAGDTTPRLPLQKFRFLAAAHVPGGASIFRI